MRRTYSLILSAAVLAMWIGCQSSTPTQSSDQQTSTPAANSAATSTRATTRPGEKASSAATASAAASIPAGEHIVIRLGNTLSSKGNNSGDSFTGTIAEAISENGKVVVPEGSSATGTVADAKPLGHFKGGALLSIVLDSITVNGKTYKVQTAAVSHTLKGKGKRSAVAIGGGAGLGALIGGLAGGGKGAAIGAAAGAGAGTAGAAFTGNKEIVLPAETAVSFKLLQPVEIQ